MLFKTIVSIILSPIILIGQIFNLSKPEIYKAPEEPVIVVQEKATSSKFVLEEKTTSAEKKETKTLEIKKKEIATTKTVVKNQVNINPPVVVTEPLPDFEKINTEARKTIINILCTTKNNDLSPISGTGVIINSEGLVLTNAHIGQYFLLKDFREKDYLKCIGRTGSPAYPKYNLELVYISPNWVENNKSLLKKQNPTGTGENDFAFLRITENIDGTKKEPLYYIQPNVRELINIGEPVLLASYPAGFLGGLSILRDLNITSAITTIQDVFTFKENTIDIVSVGGTVVSQKGSSGGLVVDKYTSLIGIITTSSDGETTSSRGLNAITISYINRALQKEISMDLWNFINLNHESYAKDFYLKIGNELSKIISDELLK